MSRYVIDALLRPPVELWSVLVALAAAVIAATAPWALMLPAAVGYSVSACLFVFAASVPGRHCVSSGIKAGSESCRAIVCM